MAIESLPDLSGLSVGELYAVYLAVANADHQWRLQALYGTAEPPLGHSELHQLPITEFENRFHLAQSIAHGEEMMRARIARQAAAYKINVSDVLARLRQAA